MINLPLSPELWLDSSNATSLLTDGAANFTASSSQYMTGTLASPLPTSGGSVAFWFNPNGNQTEYARLFDIGVGGQANGGISILFTNTASTAIAVQCGGQITPIFTAASGVWAFCVISWTSSTLSFYVNNNLIGSLTAGPNESLAPFSIAEYIGSGPYYFNGAIDSFGLWGRVLISTEMTALYNGGNGLTYNGLNGALPSLLTNLVSWYDFDSLANLGVDRAGSNTLTATNSPTFVAGIASGVCQYGGDPIVTWLDLSGNGNNATAPAFDNALVLATDSINGLNTSVITSSGQYLELTNTITLGGTWTVYGVASRELGQNFLPLGGSGYIKLFQCYTDNNTYTDNTLYSASIDTSPSGNFVYRVRRDSDNNVWVLFTGYSEVLLASDLPGTYPISYFGNNGENQYESVGVIKTETILYAMDVASTDPSADADIQGYLNYKWLAIDLVPIQKFLYQGLRKFSNWSLQRITDPYLKPWPARSDLNIISKYNGL